MIDWDFNLMKLKFNIDHRNIGTDAYIYISY